MASDQAEGVGLRRAAPPQAPSYEALPEKRSRAARAGRARCEMEVLVEVVTPIFGGGVRARELDDVDVIRVPSVRGHLRFWWRALVGHQFDRAEDLYRRESEMWGSATAGAHGNRSAIEVTTDVDAKWVGHPDDSTVSMQQADAYSLWPARAPVASRRKPGTRFRLLLVAPRDLETELRNAVRAWLLFGGYGSRTRRGLGSLRVPESAAEWLPLRAERHSLTRLFGLDIFAAPELVFLDTPWLAGSALHVGEPKSSASAAWTAALESLREFRQGTDGEQGERAREPSTDPRRPSISNWPEADKVRRLTGRTDGHPPKHNATPAWPRGGFGLPIVGRFQHEARDGSVLEEPAPFELHWQRQGENRARLASPLIVKALPLADGSFVPCALWLGRAHPPGNVVLVRRRAATVADVVQVVPRSAAPFDRLVAPGDVPRFRALAGKATLREAFLDWLHPKCKTTVVAP